MQKINKEKYPEGPWKSEPDEVRWTDDQTGLPCLILRNQLIGHLCGYVGLSKGHPAYGLDYNEIKANAHGGLTHSGELDSDDSEYWWIGFDCAHGGDLAPLLSYFHQRDVQYRDIDFVRKECTQLARQLYLRRNGAIHGN